MTTSIPKNSLILIFLANIMSLIFEQGYSIPLRGMKVLSFIESSESEGESESPYAKYFTKVNSEGESLENSISPRLNKGDFNGLTPWARKKYATWRNGMKGVVGASNHPMVGFCIFYPLFVH